jgi:hypothetical protein
MEVIRDWAKKYAVERVAPVMVIVRKSCNQASMDKCFRNHLETFLSSCFLQPSQKNFSLSVHVRLNYFSVYLAF